MKLRDALDLLVPARCLGCSRPGPSKLCDDCLVTAPWTWPAPLQKGGTLSPSPCITLLRFEGVAIDWIHRFKYPLPGIEGLDGPAWALGRYLAQRLGAQLRPLDPRLLNNEGMLGPPNRTVQLNQELMAEIEYN